MGKQADIGLIGLAVMGQNLILNMNDHGFTVAAFNRTTNKVDEFLKGPAQGTNIIGCYSIEEFVKTVKRPRKLMLMVKAGAAVDAFIEKLLPLMEPGDIIIDGGNSYFKDTERRCALLKSKGMHFVGAGISGGEEGARHGPSIMPGGHVQAWKEVAPIFQKIAAQVNGEPCCDWVGDNGAGHYVKMVHNGIEYGDIQLICEAYDIMRRGLGIELNELEEIFAEWNQGELESFLIEITSHIMGKKDEDGTFLLDKILDVAGQKGTGKWTAIESLDLAMPVTLISEAVFARCLSALKEERTQASHRLKGPYSEGTGDRAMTKDVQDALYASKIISYAQGFMLMKQAAHEYGWNLNYGGIALMWRGGCIIRSRFLGRIKEAYDKNKELVNLILDDYFTGEINRCQMSLRKVIAHAAAWGIPVPTFSAALSFFDGYRQERLPQYLLQAQRDYFGAHTYARTDKPGVFHTDWTGHGGKVSSSTYNA